MLKLLATNCRKSSFCRTLLFTEGMIEEVFEHSPELIPEIEKHLKVSAPIQGMVKHLAMTGKYPFMEEVILPNSASRDLWTKKKWLDQKAQFQQLISKVLADLDF